MAITLTTTREVTLNCGHMVSYALPAGQGSLTSEPNDSQIWACVPCWNYFGIEEPRRMASWADREALTAHNGLPGRRCQGGPESNE